jgi:hypothetical protein
MSKLLWTAPTLLPHAGEDREDPGFYVGQDCVQQLAAAGMAWEYILLFTACCLSDAHLHHLASHSASVGKASGGVMTRAFSRLSIYWFIGVLLVMRLIANN